jgi:hypothetical protein
MLMDTQGSTEKCILAKLDEFQAKVVSIEKDVRKLAMISLTDEQFRKFMFLQNIDVHAKSYSPCRVIAGAHSGDPKVEITSNSPKLKRWNWFAFCKSSKFSN